MKKKRRLREEGEKIENSKIAVIKKSVWKL